MARLAYLALWLYVFTIPWENIITLPGLGTLSRFVGIGAVGIGLLYVLISGSLRFHRVHVWGVLFVLLAAFSYFWSIEAADTLNRVFQYGLLFAFFWVLFSVLDKPEQLRGILVAYVLGCYVAGFDTITNFLSGSEAYYQRYAADGFDPGDLSFVLALGIPMAWYLAFKENSRLVWIYRLYPLVAVMVILLTAARAGLLGVAVGLLFVFFTLPRASWRVKALATVLGLVALWMIPILVPAESFSRLATLSEELTQGSLNDRTNIWLAGWQNFSDRPLLGVGAGAFGASLREHELFRDWVAPHNLFVSIATEMGLLGLGLFVLMLVSVVTVLWQMPSLERGLWLTVLAILFLAFMAQNWEWRKQTWFVLGMILTHWKLLYPAWSTAKQPALVLRVDKS